MKKITNAHDLKSWIRNAETGERVAYYEAIGGVPTERKPLIMHIAWEGFRAGMLKLFQRKIGKYADGTNLYQYEAVKT